MARQDGTSSGTARTGAATGEVVSWAEARPARRPGGDARGRASEGGDAGERAVEAESGGSGRGGSGRLLRWGGGALAGLVLLGGAGWWWSRGRDAKPDSGGADAARVPVEVARAAVRDLPIFLEGLGTVQALNTVVVRSRVDGEIVAIDFQEGQTVRKGDVLARIDPRTYQAALDQAIAKKQQDEATRGSNRTDLARTQDLANKGFAPRQQLDQQTASVGAIDAQILIDQALIDNARTQLDYTTIRAPLTGRTGLRLVDQGNIVHASDQTGIVEIAQVEPIAAIFTAPEGQLPAIAAASRQGSIEVRALRTDGREELARGTLALINNEVDTASGSVRLKATFPNGEEKLWPGLSINTRLLLKTLAGVVTVPDDAVQRGMSDLFVFVVKDDGTVDHRVVKVGPFADGMAVIEDGLKEGETVVTRGQSRLKEGSKVDPGSTGGGGTPPDNGKGGGGTANERSAGG